MSDPEIPSVTRAKVHNRESWLHEFAREFIPLMRERTGLTPSQYKLSCGFPSRGARANKSRRIGECWNMPDHKHREIFIHPQIGTSLEAADTAAHELLHAALPPGVGHRKPFSQAAKKLGLEGKPTATIASDELKERFREIINRIGEYPHEALPVGWGSPKDKGRMLKIMCPMCGFISYTTRKWLDEIGPSICPQCLITMEEADAGEEATDPLIAVDQTVEYKIKAITTKLADKRLGGYDPRWSIRMNRRGKWMNWFVLDFGPAVAPDGKAILGDVLPRLTPAENRQDAIALLEALRDGTMTYADIETDDDDPMLDQEDLEWLDEDEEEIPDVEYDGAVLFEWEERRGITVDDIDPEAERTKRESWVTEDQP